MYDSPTTLILRGHVISFSGDPFKLGHKALTYLADGLVFINGSHIIAVDAYSNHNNISHHKIIHYPHALISAGFIDSHVHMPQLEVMASHGSQLLEWLEKYTFPAEYRYHDEAYALKGAQFFINQLLAHGTTTASVFTTLFSKSCHLFFEEAKKLNLRMLAGKVMMDRHAPPYLLETVQQSYDETKNLIECWHHVDRLSYVITPRFAPTSSEALLEATQSLYGQDSSLYLQSHVSENLAECAWVKKLFPWANHYSDVYQRYGLLNRHSIYGHALYLTNNEIELFSQAEASIAHCPSSNFFLGSGVFNIGKIKNEEKPINIALGSDIGAGDSLCMLQTMNNAYKAAALTGSHFDGLKGFYLATRGAAITLDLDDKIGHLAKGMEADITILDLHSTPLIKNRVECCNNIEEILFTIMMLGDSRAIAAVYAAGKLVYQKDEAAK